MRINRGIILFMCLLIYSCNNKLTQQTSLEGHYKVYGKSDAENSRIFGYVKDKKTDIFLPNANILIKGTKIGVKTNQKGFFSIEVPSIDIKLIVTHVGNTDLSTKKLRVRKNEQLEIHFYLGTIEIN